jgi:hypothetical protein
MRFTVTFGARSVVASSKQHKDTGGGGVAWHDFRLFITAITQLTLRSVQIGFLSVPPDVQETEAHSDLVYMYIQLEPEWCFQRHRSPPRHVPTRCAVHSSVSDIADELRFC